MTPQVGETWYAWAHGGAVLPCKVLCVADGQAWCELRSDVHMVKYFRQLHATPEAALQEWVKAAESEMYRHKQEANYYKQEAERRQKSLRRKLRKFNEDQRVKRLIEEGRT